MKYLLWFAIGALVFYWITRGSRRAARRRKADTAAMGQDAGRAQGTQAGQATGAAPAAPAAPATAATAGGEAESMLQCAHCGVHVPASEAVMAGPGLAYCSPAHRLLHAPR